MVTKLNILVILFVGIVSIASTCKKNCTLVEYSFTINAKAYIDRDSIFVGDTVWVELNEPVQLLNQLNSQVINFSGAENLGTAIGFIELLGNSQSRNAANDFQIQVVKGVQLNNPNTTLIREYKFEETNGRYVFKIAIIPNRRGIYRLSLSNATNVYRKNDQCSKASFTINFKETNQHLYFNEWNYGVIVPLPNGGYCFKVI